VFSQTIGVPTLTVTARARATLAPPDILLPIAVKRFSAGDPDAPFPSGSRAPVVLDYLCASPLTPYPEARITKWPSTPSAPSNCSGGEASEEHPGPDIPILGNGVDPNTTPRNFNGLVLPEIRKTAAGVVKCYHAAALVSCTSVNANKLVLDAYVDKYGGYTSDPENPFPVAGESIGGFSGVKADTVRGIAKRWTEGDTVLVTVYSGIPDRTDSDKNWIKVLGFALFRITDADGANFIRGKAVSGIRTDPNEFLRVRRASLAPWDG
jgi:hypothetical protein